MQDYCFVGRLTRDPELRHTSDGKAVCDFGVAIQDGKDQVTFVDVTAWEKVADFVSTYFKKGKPIGVKNARLKNSSWEDKNSGEKRSKLSVVLNEYPNFLPTSKNDNEEDEVVEDVKPTKSAKPNGKGSTKPTKVKPKAEEFVTASDDDEDSDVPF
jgi:single-strand DNA-binding protein